MRERVEKRSKTMQVDRGIDIVGDIHGCYQEFLQLLGLLGYVEKDGYYRHPQGRKLLSLGDITSRGPESLQLLQFFVRHIAAGLAEMTDSNHGWKIARWLDGRAVTLAHGDEKVAEEFRQYEAEFGKKKAEELKEASRKLLLTSPSHIMLKRNGEIVAVAVHAGIRDDYIGRESSAVQTYCRYGDIAGVAADGRPIRKEWANERKSQRCLIVWGHDPRLEPEWKNNTLNIDQGCVFGGKLTAYRFPDNELVSVKAAENYSGQTDTPLTRCRERMQAELKLHPGS
ncbi:UNVERIFIED_CONTAM: hypothetical protein ABID98_004620 [Brevibacillus sp. OAP136]